MKKAIAVLISDVHYSLNTLSLADASVRMAISAANELDVPLIVAGDLHDTKANMRAECVNQMIETFNTCTTPCFILVGNHDKINERSVDHSLNFLRAEDRHIVDTPECRYELAGYSDRQVWLFPYYCDKDVLKSDLGRIDRGSLIIMHQGLESSDSGDYIQDKSALVPADLAGYRVISGHYHTRQTIELPEGGQFDYVGNPYTLTFGEANDPTKGYQVLMDDGTLVFQPTNLRKHVVYEQSYECLSPDDFSANPGDLLWVKVTGTREQLADVTKHKVAHLINWHVDFKLDLLPEDTVTAVPSSLIPVSKEQMLDSMIDSLTNASDAAKVRLKALWKDIA